MVGWHHWLNGNEFEETQGDSEGQGSLVYCSPWGPKETDTTERLNCTELIQKQGKVSQRNSFHHGVRTGFLPAT